MNKKQLKYYVSIIKKKNKNLTEEMIEKDYYLSLFLTKLSKTKNILEFNNLVFKGGTLLTKTYLKYHRFSEDLDFTYKDSNIINKIKTNKGIDKTIKKIQYNLKKDIKNICLKDFIFFDSKHPNLEYMSVRNKRVICHFFIYYKSLYSKTKISQIKIEINFIEHQINNNNIKQLHNLIDFTDVDKETKYAINYNIDNIKINCYDLDEIILEKYRAILTRKIIKERDFFDLFLINNIKNVLMVDNNKIKKKIISCFRFLPNTKRIYTENFKKINNKDVVITQEASDLTIIDYDKKEFDNFKNKIYNKLKKIKIL
jgi:predicted nucleotidyltransferase component of viral defense system